VISCHFCHFSYRLITLYSITANATTIPANKPPSNTASLPADAGTEIEVVGFGPVLPAVVDPPVVTAPLESEIVVGWSVPEVLAMLVTVVLVTVALLVEDVEVVDSGETVVVKGRDTEVAHGILTVM